MMLTYTAKLGTQFFYDPRLDGELWITPKDDNAGLTTVVPTLDLLDFCRHASGVPTKGSEQETDELMEILDDAHVFDPHASREEIRRRLHEKLTR